MDNNKTSHYYYLFCVACLIITAAYGCYQLPLEFVYGAGIFVSAMFAIIFALLFVIGCINEQFDVLNDKIEELKRR